jgi:hypothetical protein
MSAIFVNEGMVGLEHIQTPGERSGGQAYRDSRKG